MIYTQDDYEQLYNDISHKNAKHGLRWVCALGLLVALFLVMGCDSHAQDAEIMQTAILKKEVLMGMPCTWVAQCGNPISACPIESRKCVRAE